MVQTYLLPNLPTLAATVLISALAAMPALAAANEAECHQAVRKAEQELIKANVTNEQLSELGDALAEVDRLCTTGDLTGADSKLGETLKTLSFVEEN